MAYKKKPIYHFESPNDTGLDNVPKEKLVFLESADILYNLNNINGIDVNTTVQDAIVQGNLVPLSIGDMTKSTYDINNDGLVDNSERLNGQTDQYYLNYNNLTNKPTIPNSINDLSDVDLGSISAGQVLKYDGTNWVAANDESGGGSSLGETPVGGIIMYHGSFSNLPSNWALCDGSRGTPDLRDSFIYGTGTESEIGNTGGIAEATMPHHVHTANHDHPTSVTSHTGNHDHDVPHDHTASTNSSGRHTHKIHIEEVHNSANADSDYSPEAGGTHIRTETTEPAGSHTHQVTVDLANITTDENGNHRHTVDILNRNVITSSAGTSGAEDNLPPYLKLAFIKRIF